MLRHPIQHIRHSRAEAPQVVLRDVLVLELANRRMSPTVVRSTKDKDDIRIAAQIVHTLRKRAVAVILLVITRITNGRPAIRVIHQQLPALALDELRPPRLLHAVHIRLVRIIPFEIPDGITLRYSTFKRGIRVAQHGDFLILCAYHKAHQQQYR